MEMYGYFEGFPVRIVKNCFIGILSSCVSRERERVCVSPLMCYENL